MAISNYGGLTFTGASLIAASALPPGLRAGVTSPPAALVNTPAIPGVGDAYITFTASDGGSFTPASMVLTQQQDTSLATALGIPLDQEGRIIVYCFGAVNQMLAGGVVRLMPDAPGRVTFPPTCTDSYRVVIAPATSSMVLLVDDLLVNVPARQQADGVSG